MTTTKKHACRKDRPRRFGANSVPLCEQVDFTTGQASEILRVAARTVAKWCDEGLMRVVRLPGGSRDRRITRDSLIEFMRSNGMDHLLARINADPVPAPVAVGVDCAVPGPIPAGWTVLDCDYATGLVAVATTPGVRLVVVHSSVGLNAARQFAAAVRAKSGDAAPRFVIVQGDDAAGTPPGFDAAIVEPIDAAALWATPAVVDGRGARVTVCKVNGLRGEARKSCCYVGPALAGWPASPWANPYKPAGNPARIKAILYDFGVYAAGQPDSWWSDLWAACEHGRLPLGCWCTAGAADDCQHLCHAAVLGAELNRRFFDGGKS